MLTKNELKYIQSLYHKKQRDQDGLFIAEGPKLAEELINSEFEIKHVYAVREWVQRNPTVKALVTEISEIELSRVSNLQTPNEVVIVAKQTQTIGEPILKENLTIVLDGIQDPGNMGTIIRIADWFGISQIVCSNDCVEIYNPKVVQSTMGSILRVRCWYKDFEAWEFRNEVPFFGALLNGENIYGTKKATEGVVVIGNESKGIREPMLSNITHPVTIPRTGAAESLNAAVATGIIVGCLVNLQGQ
ncbi:RNA methyltransferase [Segetibacter aerophilus]|uniref:tRNA/rRNA methyltransferase n=1 Tax=Segetibacter aerophilus TaxID=670293 RepID=A0A512BDF0_9BACT|nr:RNA methyltransferase [Segetibacter aerophilus]GEO09993.1 tRNA/rRNA methyltransferase [Segetibacter aerophilus]